FTFLILSWAALLTYNTILSINSNLTQDFPDAPPYPDPVIGMPASVSSARKPRRLFHTALTASDSIYNAWQSRVMYYWFKKHRDRPTSEMGGFTRILHSGVPDRFMDEIPTFVAQPLPEGVDQGFVVLNRCWGVVQWLQKVEIVEDYVLMAEPDHLIVKPIPNLSVDGFAAAYSFFYIEPQRFENILRRYLPREYGPITEIDPIGNSPVIIHKDDLRKVAPTWMNVSLAMKRDPEADKEFGWVLDMYGYAVASALEGVRNLLRKEFMVQPPWSTEIGKAYIIHYTYGCDYDLKGKFMPGKYGEWRFDKRSYSDSWPPRNLSLPPPGVPETVVTLVKMVNEASANLPNWGS
ncbi:hypothetical protein M569_07861, partial [Genlisea aurea]